jgi:RNA polymerase sigma-70 factor, ECF subfamily
MSPRAMAQRGAASVDACSTAVDTSESGMFTRLELPRAEPGTGVEAARANALVRDNLRLVWRLLRRLGLSPSDADDATQRVFFTAVQRIERIQLGSERAFVCRTAVRIASKIHAASKKRLESEFADALDALADSTPSLEDLADRHRARQLFDQVLDSMPLELKAVFVLFEIERLSTSEVAEALGIPRGTAASRLRRARVDFEQRVHRLEARIKFRGALK